MAPQQAVRDLGPRRDPLLRGEHATPAETAGLVASTLFGPNGDVVGRVEETDEGVVVLELDRADPAFEVSLTLARPWRAGVATDPPPTPPTSPTGSTTRAASTAPVCEPVHLFSLLSNFEPPQLTDAPGATSATPKQARTRAELQKRADDLHAELVTRYTAGETVKALAVEHGLHHQTVRAVLERAGVLVRTRQRLAQADVDEIVRLYDDGLTTTEIGERFGVYASTIGRKLKKLGVELRAPGWRVTAERS